MKDIISWIKEIIWRVLRALIEYSPRINRIVVDNVYWKIAGWTNATETSPFDSSRRRLTETERDNLGPVTKKTEGAGFE
ncbi:MAG: hypothetical protein A2167_03255 [Planctomycetes bacterium RBG_13_46_10]|nr:MAG: hypothetical protein A2167_03255 [Planctomycetes bacterium RBG_13_46_10]